jgi:hypothetical protein
MPDWPLLEGQRYAAGGVDAANSRGTTVTTGTANVKSASWVQLIASTPFEATGMMVTLSDAAAGGDFLVDIAIGAAGQEVVICPNLCAASGTGSVTRGAFYFIPISIPAGSRISAKSQSSLAAASTIRVSLHFMGQGFISEASLSRVIAYGANTADSGGVTIDPGTVANTKGTADPGGTSGGWFTIGTTTSDTSALFLAFPNIVGSTTRASTTWLVDISIGPQGSRTILIPDLLLQCSTTDDLVLPTVYGPFPVEIPSGTVLGARASSPLTTATTRLFDIIAYGVN